MRAWAMEHVSLRIITADGEPHTEQQAYDYAIEAGHTHRTRTCTRMRWKQHERRNGGRIGKSSRAREGDQVMPISACAC